MLDEAQVNRLYAKFRTTVAPDISQKFDPFLADEVRNLAAEVQGRGIDFAGYIENDEDAFLQDLARRVRERLDDAGVQGIQRPLTGINKDIRDWQDKFLGRGET